MKKTITAFVAAAMLATVPLAASTQDAAAIHKQWHKGLATGIGVGVGLGIVQSLTQPKQKTVIVQQAPQVIYTQPNYSQAHYAWCQGRYNSYDIGSNTYLPSVYAARRQCVSPYM
jgi:hypothetical protein